MATLHVTLNRSQRTTYSESARNLYNNILLQNRSPNTVTVIPNIAPSQPLPAQHLSTKASLLASHATPSAHTFNKLPAKTAGMLAANVTYRGQCIQNQQRIQETVKQFPMIHQARQTIIKTEVYNAISALKQCNFVKSSDIAVNARNLSLWHRLPTLKISHPEAHRFMQKVVNVIQKKTIDKDGFYLPLSKEDITINEAIAQFEKVALEWIDNREKSIWENIRNGVRNTLFLSPINDSLANACAYDSDNFVSCHAERLAQLTRTEIAEFSNNSANWEFLDSHVKIYDQELHNKITNSVTYQKLCAVETACQKRDFQEAAHIIPTIAQDFAQYAATKTYNQYFFEKHLSDGIDKKFSNHADYLKHQAELQPLYSEHGLIIPHTFNTELTRNSKLYQQIIKDLGIANPCEAIKNLIYEKLIPLIKSSHTHDLRIKNAVVNAIQQNIKEMSSTDSSGNITQSTHYQIINHIENAYNAMQQGNPEAKNYLERGLLSGINNNILAFDHDKQAEFFEKVGLKAEFQHWKSCQDRNAIAQSLYTKEFKVYEFPAHILQLLKDHNLTIEDYSQLYGNGLQHFNHIDFIKQLDAQSQLRQKVTDKALTKLTHLSTRITENARAANASSDVQQAMILSNFNWKIINFVKEAGIFCFDLQKEVLSNVGRATLDAAHGLYDTVTHPITSLENTVRGLVHLADTAITIVDIADGKLHDITYGTADKNQLQVLQDLGKQSKEFLSSVIDYGQKEGVPRLAGKAAYAATSLAWDTAITGKSIQLMNKFAKIAHSKEMGQFLQKAANALNKAPELEAVTAEGFKVTVPKGAKVCSLSEASEIIKNKPNIIFNNKKGINCTPRAILKDGYYEVNGFKFTKKYYEKLWDAGRQAPSLRAKEILDHAKIILPDSMPGFFRYEFNNWELIFNPTTREIWHICKK